LGVLFFFVGTLFSHDFKIILVVLSLKAHGSENARASFPLVLSIKIAGGVILVRSTVVPVSTQRPISVTKGMPCAHWFRPCHSPTSEPINVKLAAQRVEQTMGMGGGQPTEGP